MMQSLIIAYFFAFLKEGNHSDEVWNYAFANSYETKELTESDSGVSYMNRWNSADMFHKYLSVEKEHRFAYGSVYKNVSRDLNPPLQYLILHTICSFFPGVFSWWFCFAINVVAFAVTQVFLFMLEKEITENDVVALAAVLLYGFGIGAINIAIFMRIYALGVMFMIMFAYYSNRVYRKAIKGEKIIAIDLVKLSAVCFCGAYTLYLFLITAFFMTACYCIFYLCTKRIRVLFQHGLSCLAGAVLSILLFPATFIGNAANIDNPSYAVVKYPFGMQLRYYFYMITRDLFGLHVSPFPNPYLEWFLIALGCLIFLSVPVFFVFRKDQWFRDFLQKGRNWAVCTIKKIKGFNITLVAFFFSFAGIMIIASDRTSVYGMAGYSSRYIFIIYPILLLLTVCIVYFFLYLLNIRKNIIGIVVLVLCVGFALWTHLVDHNDDYLFLSEKEGTTAIDFEENANSILVLTADWYVVSFAPELEHTNSYYATNFWRIKENEGLFDGADTSQPYYIIVSKSHIFSDDISYEQIKLDPFYGKQAESMFHEGDFLDCFRKYDIVDSIDYIGSDKKMTGKYLYYRINFKQ